jgi:biopolymer transport protein ExbB/TolQ
VQNVQDSEQPKVATRGRRSGASSNISMVILGLLATGAFYAIAPRIPGTGSFVQRYFCGHPLEYVSTGLFFVAGGLMLAKLIRLPRETRSLKHASAAMQTLDAESMPDTRFLETFQKKNSAELAATVLQYRIDDARQFVRSSPNSSLEDHLRYLADLAADRLHQSFALLRTIAWAIPIVGFLGTVIGITIAIANVTPEQLESSLPEVTGGLAVAFDTTAQALGMSIVLVLGTFLVERGEQLVLNDVERFGIDCLLSAWSTPASAARRGEMIPGFDSWSQELIAQQTQAWDKQLSSLREGWDTVLRTQTTSLQHALEAETENTLDAHRHELEAARAEHRDLLNAESTALATQLDSLFTKFAERVGGWQQALQTSSLSSAGQAEELHRIGRVLLQMTESEERLAQLQKQLNQNIESLQIVDTLEQTLSGLNAAVHVLTAKSLHRTAA